MDAFHYYIKGPPFFFIFFFFNLYHWCSLFSKIVLFFSPVLPFSNPDFMKVPCVVRLIDFKHCVDTGQFGEDRLFVGCPMSDRDPNAVWLCPLMKGGKPWKWQVDYFGLAVSMLAFITNAKQPRLVLDRQTGNYETPELPL